ncbi:hypothetical protein A0J61_07882 [Choanephora cucurbitarum]|uniref:Zinc finger Mcm10/DnaG-type domain-containing protein n=1 Tax=Choanephora cucurbitarum TaxID=101091 RepID=A0A1C7N609_9FUNG|nr:hypothetical protein A0J61_07882 [Choanephora cucurbitarum]
MRKAFTKYDYAIGLGSVVAVKRPFLLKPTETGQSVALHVDQIQQMWVIGQSLDLVQCAGYAKKDMRCSAWTDSRTGEFCDKHLEKVYNYSKNGRMELASGNSGFDIRWATQIKQTDGTLSYESKRQKKPVDSVAKLFGNRFKSKQAYYIKGKGLVTTDGTIMKQALAKKEPTEAEKDELKKFLRGRRDPGAEMIRKIKGIEDEGPKTVLSNEALDKLGIGSKSLSKEEEESKKRSFEALNKATKENATENKKPRFVYL